MTQVHGLAYIDLARQHHRSFLVCGGPGINLSLFMKQVLKCEDFLDFTGERSQQILDFFNRISAGEKGLTGIFNAATETAFVLYLTAPTFNLALDTIASVDFFVFLKNSTIIQAIAEPTGFNESKREIVMNYPFQRGKFDELIWSGKSVMLEKLAYELELPVTKLIQVVNRESWP